MTLVNICTKIRQGDKMLRASEAAIDLLIEVQKECEELYMSSPDPELVLLSAGHRGQDAESKTPPPP